MTFQYDHAVRREIDKFFDAPETWGDVMGTEVTFLTVIKDDTYTRTGRVYDFRQKKHNLTLYSIVTESGYTYHNIPRHHIRGLPEISDSI